MKDWTTKHIEALQARNFKEVVSMERRSKANPTKPKPETANQITTNIIRVINFQPRCIAYRINNVGVWDEKKLLHRGGNTEKGLPDIWACIRGRFVTIEVKAGKDKMSEHQQARRFEIEKAGGIYFEARSTDEFLKWFETFKNN